MLVISEVQIEFIKPVNGLIGFASLVINESVYISSIAIHKKLNAEGYRLTYPSKGKFAIFHPINKETSQAIEEAIFNKLKEVKIKKCNDHDRYNKNSNTFE
ncbi:MAG: septation protein SpoVG family protein [Alphaproteobacteria bacterium]|nr:septation protein SpoVG family protein [Rickettsiales bacterium]